MNNTTTKNIVTDIPFVIPIKIARRFIKGMNSTAIYSLNKLSLVSIYTKNNAK